MQKIILFKQRTDIALMGCPRSWAYASIPVGVKLISADFSTSFQVEKNSPEPHVWVTGTSLGSHSFDLLQWWQTQ